MSENAPDNQHDPKQSLQERWRSWSEGHQPLAILITAVVAILLALGIALALSLFLWALFPSSAPAWTGFNSTPHPLWTGRVPTKNLWDWMGLLLIPALLGLVAAVIGRAEQNREMRERAFDRQQAEQARENEWALEKERQEQALLDRYFERMTGFLLEYNLHASGEDDDIRTIARAMTLGVLRSLSPWRKGQVIKFLYEADLLNTPRPIVDLAGAGLEEIELLSAVLPKAHLAGTDMHNAKMNRADLSGADLSRTNLIEAELRKADLQGASLPDAYLSACHLREARLQKADLSRVLLNNAVLVQADLRQAALTGANLVGADLSQAQLEGADLSGAKTRPAKAEEDEPGRSLTLTGATHDETTTWPEDFDPAEAVDTPME